jgi:hypothetical protein
LVPDDNSKLSDKSLSYAVYLSNSTVAKIVILNVVKRIDKIESTTISATIREDNKRKAIVEDVKNKTDKNNIQITLEGQAEQTVKERIRFM